jgi:HSP90 family molecular chaperone
MIERAAKAFQEGRFLQEFIPCPQDLIDTVSGFVGEEQAALEAKQATNREKYGYATWYEHNINEWGTKWDVNSDNVEIEDANTVTAGFDSAWSPPITAYEQLIEQGFDVVAFYYEPGMAFVGKWDNGNDDCY